MSPKVSKEYFDLRKKQILEAAWECFAEKGYDKTTIRDIAKNMGASIGIIYKYFKSKNEILDSISEMSQEDRNIAFEEAGKYKVSRDALKALFAQKFISCPPDKLKKGAQGNINIWGEAINRESFNTLFNSHHRQTVDHMTSLITQGKEKGEIPDDINTQTAASFYTALFMGLQVQAALVEGLQSEKYFESIKYLLTRSIWRESKKPYWGKDEDPLI
ncbi:TetR/AcrR family transcriptional regulator [Acidobacteriota bacterium]